MTSGEVAQNAAETIHLQQQVARLQALLEASRQVHGTVREEDVLEQVLRIVVRELEMAGAAFPVEGLSYGEPLTDDNLRCAPRYALEDRDGRIMTELVVAAPECRVLSLYETDFLEGLVLQAAVALENARNHKRMVEFARVQQDLDAARLIQRSLLPQHLPSIPGYSLAYRSSTCYEVGGDYLDIVTQPGGGLLFAVADVAGKGLASAIMSTSFRSAFRAMATSGLSLEELAERMNQHHWSEGEEARRRYVTAIFLSLDTVNGCIDVVNAGHNPGFLLTPGEEPHLFAAAGTPLGLLPGMSYTRERRAFPPGSRLLFYTDGLTEIFQGDEEFGQDRLLREFLNCAERNSDAMLDAMWAAIDAWSAGGPQADDMTALALCRAAAGEKPE